MVYRALTIDTNVAYGGGFDFEHGLLRQLQQFSGSADRFILSAVVEAEILKRLQEMNVSTSDKFLRVAQDALARGLLSDAEAPAVHALSAAMIEPNLAARKRLDTFVTATGAAIVPADLAATSDLVRLYTTPLPPFEATGPKKTEFPDAIALLSLEAWGRENGPVLAVSKDKGWRDYAAKSPLIDVVDDLADALAIFQEQAAAEKAARAVAGLLGQIQAGALPDLATALRSRIETRAEEIDPDIEAHSYHEMELELASVTFTDYELSAAAEDGFDVTVVRVEDDLVAVTTPVVVHVSFEVAISLMHWDSIDREYVYLGTQYQSVDTNLYYDALITFNGDLATPDELDIDDVELVNGNASIELGEIEMDVGDGR